MSLSWLKYKALDPVPGACKLGMVVRPTILALRRWRQKDQEVEDQPKFHGLYSKLEASLGYTRPVSKKGRKGKGERGERQEEGRRCAFAI